MKVSDPIKRAVPFCLCLCILCCLLPAIAAISGSTASIKLCILSDLHYLAAADQAAADGNEWRLYGESAPATEEAIEAVIRQRPDVLLFTIYIAGYLSKNFKTDKIKSVKFLTGGR